jgi:membrane protease YdiL (CAAX protease family)
MDLPVDDVRFAPKGGGWHPVSFVVSWAIIFMLMGVMFFGNSLEKRETREEVSQFDLLEINMMAKFQVGARSIEQGDSVPFVPAEIIAAEPFVEKYWCDAIVLNELKGPQAALEHLDIIRAMVMVQERALTETQARIDGILTRLFDDYDQDDWLGRSVSDEEKSFLVERLGFCGTLVQLPSKTPLQSERKNMERGALYFTAGTLGVMMVMALTLFAGFIGLLVILASVLSRKLVWRFAAGSGRAHIYVETFALWFVAFLGLQLGVSILAPADLTFVSLGGAFVLSLGALVWPVLRGVSWQQVRQDIGWTRGAGVIQECFWGGVAYVCLTPVIALAFVFVAILSEVLGMAAIAPWAQLNGPNAPVHPIVFELANNNPLVVWPTLFLAIIAAPVIEETMFRGVLYRHLRDSTIWLRTFLSVVVSAGISSFIFAAIHPQGLLFIPVLGTLAFGIALVREWRGSIVAPMTMHAINNSMATVILLLILGNASS